MLLQYKAIQGFSTVAMLGAYDVLSQYKAIQGFSTVAKLGVVTVLLQYKAILVLALLPCLVL